jgi:hypothetical protein
LEKTFGKRENFDLKSEADGSLYLGQWKKGGALTFSSQKFGRGSHLTRLSNGECLFYEGYWKDGKKEGKGRLINVDGSVYEGDMKADRVHGMGVVTFN